MRTAAPAWDEALRRGKESVVCDLKRDAAFARALCARADVVLEGFRPGVAARLGVGPEDVPPGVVYCSITGFGTSGRHAARVGHDLNYLGWAGALADTGREVPPVQVADLAAGALRAVAEILAALFRRERTGEGARLVVSMTHGSHDLVAHRLQRRPAAAAPHGRAGVLRRLRGRRRPPAHRRGARARVLHTALRGDRPPRARGAAVRGGPGGAARRSRGRPCDAGACRLARPRRGQRTSAWGPWRRSPRRMPISGRGRSVRPTSRSARIPTPGDRRSRRTAPSRQRPSAAGSASSVSIRSGSPTCTPSRSRRIARMPSARAPSMSSA